MVGTIDHFIDGRIVEGRSGRYGDVFNPATGEVSGRVAFASRDEVGKAIEAAQAALPGWALTAPLQRARVMFRFKALLEGHMDELAELLTAEHGKVPSDARGGMQRGLEVVEFACGVPHPLQ